jgi:hypothetical protein
MAAFGHSRRCSHIKVTGHRCGSPALHGDDLCYFHAHIIQRVRARIDHVMSPIALIENEEAIQVSLMTLIDSILKGTIEPKRAQLILRALSIAERNSRRARIGLNTSEMVRRVPQQPAEIAQPAVKATSPHFATPKACHPSHSEEPVLSLPKEPALSLPKEPALSLPKEPALSLPKGPALPLEVSTEKSLTPAKEQSPDPPLTDRQLNEERALHDIECALEGALRGDLHDCHTVFQAAGLLDPDGHL